LRAAVHSHSSSIKLWVYMCVCVFLRVCVCSKVEVEFRMHILIINYLLYFWNSVSFFTRTNIYILICQNQNILKHYSFKKKNNFRTSSFWLSFFKHRTSIQHSLKWDLKREECGSRIQRNCRNRATSSSSSTQKTFALPFFANNHNLFLANKYSNVHNNNISEVITERA
jgi:hypothetical protein